MTIITDCDSTLIIPNQKNYKNMKKNLFLAAAALLLVLTGCEKKSETTNYSISPNPASVEVGKTVQLSLSPAATAVWTSKNEAVATVDNNGLVTGVAVGQAVVTATVGDLSASAIVNVTKQGENPNPNPEPDPSTLHKSLQGSEYYIIQMDEITMAKIKSKVKADLRANDPGDATNTHSFFFWEETYEAGTTAGRNFYGEAEGWYSLQVLTKGWSGASLSIHNVDGISSGGAADMNPLAAIMAKPEDYYFHIAMKSTDNATHLIELDGAAGTKGKVAIGAKGFDDNGVITPAVTDFTRDGSWGEIEIPMTTFTNQGLRYVANNTENLNVIVFLSGGVAGTMLQFDACFIYKK